MHETAAFFTSCLKSDVTILFLDPDFFIHAKMSEIRVHLRQIYDYLMEFCL